jgi:hypothetical protein
MTKTIWTGTCSAIVGLVTAAVTAQTPTPPQSSSTNSERSIVVTGCLKPAPSSPTDTSAAAGTVGTTGTVGAAGAAGTTGTAGTTGATAATPASDAMFVLVNATPAPADTTGAPSATSTAGTTEVSTSSPTQTYRLIANSSALIPLVGKKLELTGTLDPDNASAAASEPSAGPALRVKSGKIVAASCSE